MNKKYILLVLVIVLSITLIFGVNTKGETKLDNVKLNDKVDKRLFAIMLEQEDGKYQESKDDKWPEHYTYNSSKSGCMDINGKKVEEEGILTFDNSTHQATVKTSKTVYCYLYFDRDKEAPTITKFYVGNSEDQEYINSEQWNTMKIEGIPYTIEFIDEDIEEYCVTENDTCSEEEWHKVEDSNIKVINDKIINGELTEGSHTYHAYLKDIFGNINKITDLSDIDEIGNDKIILDTTPEVISRAVLSTSANLNGRDLSKNNVVFGYKTGYIVLLWDYPEVDYYCISDKPCDPTDAVEMYSNCVYKQMNFVVGENHIYVKLKDTAGNITENEYTFIVDIDRPVINSVSIVADDEDDVTVKVDATDDTGVTQYCYTVVDMSNYTLLASNVCTDSNTYKIPNSHMCQPLNIAVTIRDVASHLANSGSVYKKRPKVAAPGTVLAGKEDLNSCEVGGMYRYQGSKDEIDKNYICFGTSDKTTCTSNPDLYMYRIIGITPEGSIKVIKQTSIKEGSINYFKWGSGSTLWSKSDLWSRLNGKSLNNVSGESGGTNIFIGSSSYSYMNDSLWTNKIISKKLYEGYIDISYYSYNTIDDIYKAETGQISAKYKSNDNSNKQLEMLWTTGTESKVSLLNIHDYFYAAIDNDAGTGAFCYGSQYDDTCANGWLNSLNKTSSNSWTMSSGSLSDAVYRPYSYFSLNLLTGAEGTLAGTDLLIPGDVLPAFYLTSDIRLTGAGSVSDPFIINN